MKKLSTVLKERYGEKVYKISLDGGFTCPNRDGKCGLGGCIFCGEKGAGEHTLQIPLHEQMECGIRFAREKKHANKFIAYFQSFTGSYAPTDVLREKYNSVMLSDDVIGLSVATRPDCVDENFARLMCEFSPRLLITELGLQTANDATAKLINRGYETSVFRSAVNILKSHGIEVVAHLIVGLPNETIDDVKATADFVADCQVDGIKIHSLYVLDETTLADMYRNGEYTPITREYYVEAVGEILSRMPENIVIHRLTGDGDKAKILVPEWTKEKKKNLNALSKFLS